MDIIVKKNYTITLDEEEYQDLIKVLKFVDNMKDMNPCKEDEIKEMSSNAFDILNEIFLE